MSDGAAGVPGHFKQRGGWKVEEIDLLPADDEATAVRTSVSRSRRG